jgi:hypothetical protein
MEYHSFFKYDGAGMERSGLQPCLVTLMKTRSATTTTGHR